jgi:UDP-glucose 4-epimerase
VTSPGAPTVLVTGADGFIGSHLTERLVRDGSTVRAFCFYNSRGSAGWLDGHKPDNRLEVFFGDVRDEGAVRRAMEGIDTVFHLAALVGIPYSYVAPASVVDTNVRGTLNILEAARATNVRRVVHTSTSEVYGSPDVVPITESHALKGQSPYSASKIAADKLCEAYAASYGIPVVVLRPFNTFGPRQSERAVIPAILSQMLAGRPKIQIGSLETKRDFTYVDDTVEAFLLAGQANLLPGEVVHLGSGRAYSIGEVFEHARTFLGVSANPVVVPERMRPTASEIPILLSDPSKALRALGWRATTTFEEGLRLTADWMRTAGAGYDGARYAI